MKDFLEINSNRRADFDLIIGVFLAYTCTAITVSLVNHDQISFYDIYFLIINLLLLSILFFKKKSFCHLKNKLIFNKDNIIQLLVASILILGISAYILYTNSNERDVWLDEYTQFIFSGKKSISIFAAIQQQPPLDYFFSNFSRIILGVNPFAVKVHVVSFFILTMLSSFYLSYIQVKKIHIAIIYPLSLMTSSLICFQSYEARPVILSIFTGSLFIFSYFQYLYSKNISLSYILITQLLFLFSIGLQPMILIASCFLGGFLYEKKITEKIKNLFFTHLISFFIYSLFCHLIYQKSKGANQFKDITVIDKIELIKNIKISDFFKYFDHQSSFILYFLLPLFFFFFITDKLRKRKNSLSHMVFSVCFFAISFEIIYVTMINWNFHPRYFITISILLSFIGLQAMERTDRWLICKKKSFLLKIGTLPCFLLLIFHRENSHYYIFPSYKKIYRYLEDHASSKDIILNFSLSATGSWRPHLFISKELYYKKEQESRFIYPIHYPDLNDKIPIGIEKITTGNIFLIQFSEYMSKDIFFHKYSLDNIESNYFYKKNAPPVRIIKIKRKGSEERLFEKYLFYLLKKFKNKNELSLVYETLVMMKINRREFKEASEIISNYEHLEGSHKKTFEGVIYNFKDDLKKRISFLRNILKQKNLKH